MKVYVKVDGSDGMNNPDYKADTVIETHASHAEMLFKHNFGEPRDDAAQGVYDLLAAQGALDIGGGSEATNLVRRTSKDGE